MSYTYDNNGNMLSESNGKTYSYNALNQLVSFYDGEEYTTTYTYLPNGLRASKTSGNNENHIHSDFVWDGDDLVYEYVRNMYYYPPLNNCIVYNYGNGLISQSNTETNEYILFTKNTHGDVSDMLNAASTDLAVFEDKEFDAFGNGGTTQYSAMGYAGQYHDYETGFIYLRARYYSPAVGRFINEDPIRDGLNWYVYCNNNPVNYIDPNGLSGIKTDGTYYITHPLDKELLKLKQEYDSATPERQAQIAIEAQNIRNSGTEGVDWSVRADRTLNYYMIDTDVTKKLNDVIKSSESENWWKRFGEVTLVTNAARYVDFALMVRPGGKYDLKSKSEWQGKEHFIYNGEIIWYDEPGNILYGHLGKVMGFEDVILKIAGGAAQIATRNSSWSYVSSYFDDPRDQKAIQKGIDIFKNTHS